MKPTNLIDAKEAATRLGITRDAVLKRTRSGKLTHVFKAPGTTGAYFYDPRTIDRIAANQTK